MITLPTERLAWPLVRVLVAPTFNSRWTPVPMWREGQRGFGFELLRFTRTALPGVGEAYLQFRYGMISGTLVGAQPLDQLRQPWDPETMSLDAPDLRGYEVRIQMAEQTPDDPAWYTMWWGQVEEQRDQEWPGAGYPAGVRSYYCVDGFFRAKRWMLDCHSACENGTFFIQVDGHPGYNVGRDGRVLGNKSSTSFSSVPDSSLGQSPSLLQLAQLGDNAYALHTHQGSSSASSFTVLSALESALRERRPFGQPVFSFNGTTALLGDAIAMPVQEGDSAWDLVARHCRRERGRGLVWVDWNTDAADPDAPLVVFLSVQPQTYDDITWTNPVGSSTVIPGAANTTLGRLSTAIDVDLQGDHRLVADDFQIGQPNLQRADAVETVGEKIQVLATLAYVDKSGGTSVSLASRWTAARATEFALLEPEQRKDEAWQPLWCLHGLPLDWYGYAGNGNGVGIFGCDARCDDDGFFTVSSSNPITSPLLVQIMPDLPIYEGYDYSVQPPVRKIGNSGVLDEASAPARRAPFALIRAASDRYLFAHELDEGRGMTLHVRGRDLLLFSTKDQEVGERVASDTSDDSLNATYDLADIAFTVGLELPHRVRRRTVRTVNGSQVAVNRTVRVRLPDLHLWVASSGAIWDLDATGIDEDGMPGKRGVAGASNATLGLIRDDRAALSRLHAMACAWYLGDRRTATWSMRACGFLPDFAVDTTDSADNPTTGLVDFPQIGQVVHEMQAGGQTRTLDTPITSMAYDHTTGITTWQTDWPELDVTP